MLLRLRRALVAACTALAVAWVVPAEAQVAVSLSLKNNADGVVRGESYNPALLFLNQFNHENCVANEEVTFRLNVTGPTTLLSAYHVEAWIGPSCDLSANRADYCAKLGETSVSDTTMKIRVHDMVDSLETAGTGIDDDACTGATGATPSDRMLYFMLLDADSSPPNTDAGWLAKWAFKYDMAGPPAPLSVTASPTQSGLTLTWSPAPDAPIDLKQYVFLCDPPPGSEPDVPPDKLCPSDVFQEGDVPSLDVISQHECGYIESTQSSGRASPLANGAAYTVAIFSRDGYYNAGPVSAAVCGTPEEMKDFFKDPGAAGQPHHGASCAMSRTPARASSVLALLAAVGTVGLVARRRQRRAARAAKPPGGRWR